MAEKVSFQSDGLKIAGLIDTPPDYKPGERRPAFIVLHGFGGNKDGQGQAVVAKQFAQWGYRDPAHRLSRLRRERRRARAESSVSTKSPIRAMRSSYLATRAEVDPQRIALVGSSFGAAVAVFTGGADQPRRRGDLLRRLGQRRAQISRPASDPGRLGQVHQMLEEGKRHRERTGKSLMVPRYDIVPIPEKLRNRMSHGSIMEFPAETAQSMNDFRADDLVGSISPRPLLLLHSANDSVTPTYESIEMFKRARQPAELHLLSDIDHFTFNEENPRLTRIVADWLARYFPANKN